MSRPLFFTQSKNKPISLKPLTLNDNYYRQGHFEKSN